MSWALPHDVLTCLILLQRKSKWEPIKHQFSIWKESSGFSYTTWIKSIKVGKLKNNASTACFAKQGLLSLSQWYREFLTVLLWLLAKLLLHCEGCYWVPLLVIAQSQPSVTFLLGLVLSILPCSMHASEASPGFGGGGKAGLVRDAFLLVPQNGFVVCIPPAKKGFGM